MNDFGRNGINDYRLPFLASLRHGMLVGGMMRRQRGLFGDLVRFFTDFERRWARSLEWKLFLRRRGRVSAGGDDDGGGWEGKPVVGLEVNRWLAWECKPVVGLECRGSGGRGRERRSPAAELKLEMKRRRRK